MKIKRIIKLVFVIIWMGIIFSFSSDNSIASTEKSDSVIIKTVEFFLGRSLDEAERETWTDYLVFPVRKGAHFFLYFVLGILMISLCQEFFGIIYYRVLFLAVFLSFLYACSDEIHQLFVAGRSGQFIDVVLDTFGSIVGILVYQFIYNKVKRRKKYE